MGWRAQLDGHRFDLDDLVLVFGGDDPSVVQRPDGTYWLLGSMLNHASDLEEAAAIASKLMPLMNGTAKLQFHEYRPVRVYGVFEGPSGRHVRLEASESFAGMRTRDRATITVNGEPAVNDHPASMLVEKGLARIDVAEVLELLALPDIEAPALAWFFMYKVFEILRESVGGEKALATSGLMTQKEISAFKASANRPDASGEAARHARMNGDPAKQTMSPADAKSWLLAATKRWLLDESA